MAAPSPLVLGLTLITLVVCGAAIWKGTRAERYGALIILANQALSFAADYALHGAAASVTRLTIDGSTATALLFVVIVYGAPWLGVTMLLYAAQFGLQSFYLVTEREVDFFYAVANNVIFFSISLSLAAGMAWIWFRRRRTQR